jgi:predicted RNase H-like HicB family nuclease
VIQDYLQAAAARARYEQLEDGTWCAQVRGLQGVIAVGRTLEACRSQLLEVVEEWVLVRIAKGLSVPRLGRAAIRIRKAG